MPSNICDYLANNSIITPFLLYGNRVKIRYVVNFCTFIKGIIIFKKTYITA